MKVCVGTVKVAQTAACKSFAKDSCCVTRARIYTLYVLYRCLSSLLALHVPLLIIHDYANPRVHITLTPVVVAPVSFIRRLSLAVCSRWCALFLFQCMPTTRDSHSTVHHAITKLWSYLLIYICTVSERTPIVAAPAFVAVVLSFRPAP